MTIECRYLSGLQLEGGDLRFGLFLNFRKLVSLDHRYFGEIPQFLNFAQNVTDFKPYELMRKIFMKLRIRKF